jgi:RNA polymerase I-specific transcription initiation factor RRN6
MFPTKKGLGVQLNYGIPGPNLFVTQFDPEKPWIFSREREGGAQLQKVINSTTRLMKPQVANLDIHDDKDHLYKQVIQDVPIELLKSLKEDPKGYTDCDLVYDPALGKMLDYGSLRIAHKPDVTPVVAYVSGEYKDCLVVQHVSKRKEDVRLAQDVVEMEFPILTGGASLEFESAIQQIEICKGESVFQIPQTDILVRTRRGCSVVKTVITKNSSVELQRTNDFTFEELGEDITHVSANPFDTQMIAMIGAGGRWVICKRTSLKMHVVHRGQAFVPEEVSNFKRIAWCADTNRVLLIGRTYVKEVRLSSGESVDVVSATQWSSIREYCRWETVNKFGFLLTSRELIWIDTEYGFKRVLSWKHYMNADDPSLGMFIKFHDEIQYVCLYSQTHPLVIVFQFKLEDGYPKSVHDPFIVKTDAKTTAQSFALLPMTTQDEGNDEEMEPIDGVWLTLFRLSNQLELTRVVLSDQSASVVKNKQESRRASEVEITPALEISKKTNYEDISQKLFAKPSIEEADDYDIFQKFATSFDVSTLHDSRPVALKDKEEIQGFKSIEEFDNLLEQLHEYCKEQKINYTTLKDFAQHVLDDRDISLFNELRDKLSQTWNNSTIASQVTRDLGLALSVFYDEDREGELVVTNVNTLSSKMKTIVDHWGKEHYSDEEKEGTNVIDRADIPQVSQPIITVTQSQPQDTLKRPMSQKFSQKATQASQSQRKKRRVKGFA